MSCQSYMATNHLCINVINQIWTYLTADVYECDSNTGQWKLRKTYSLKPITSYAQCPVAECLNNDHCINPCPYNESAPEKPRLKSQYCVYNEGAYLIEKGILFFEEGGFLNDEQLKGENFIDIVITATLKWSGANLIEKKIETIWGTGGRKIIVKYKGTPIFSCLANRVKDNIILW